MGGGASSSSALFDYQYRYERTELRKALIDSFLNDSDHEDIIYKINAIRRIITLQPQLCRTAVIEKQNEVEFSPTCLEAAQHELERLYTIYETSTILKSKQCRTGSIACPLGHNAAYFEMESLSKEPSIDFKFLFGEKSPTIKCNICDKGIDCGYQCFYCSYHLCKPCSVIYCSFAHPMKLWTHAESQHSCILCNSQPITSGYRCLVCDDYDICDMCTYKNGRKKVQDQILERVGADLKYMEDHITESKTAMKTVTNHRKKMESNSYPTIKDLYEFSTSLHDIQVICVEEVRQTRIMKECIRLREILIEGIEYSATARREVKVQGIYTQLEMERLRLLVNRGELAKSTPVRESTIVACPLGHAAMYYTGGRPQQYMERDEERTQSSQKILIRKADTISKDSIEMTASEVSSRSRPTMTTTYCSVCKRVALEGYHCDFCEYDLCMTCAVIFCFRGHPMVMWTVPDSISECYLCQNQPISSGYHCNYCTVDVCDMCTTAAGRGNVRNAWDAEMNQLLEFMQENKRYSDQALYYHWRHVNHIVSTGNLVAYVKELRVAKKHAIRQIQQKEIIDEIKKVREDVCKHIELNATAARESVKSKAYLFKNKMLAQAELDRLKVIQSSFVLAQNPDRRRRHGIACPLGHGMISITELPIELQAVSLNQDGLVESSTEKSPDQSVMKRYYDDDRNEWMVKSDAVDESVKIKIKIDPSSSVDNALSADTMKEEKSSVMSVLDDEGHLIEAAERRKNKYLHHSCQICGTSGCPIVSMDSTGAVVRTNQGFTCTICEYDLCSNCSLIYCRKGHQMKIWTLSDAISLCCDMCKTSPIVSGYRCVTCDIDICDFCTSKDSRNAFMLWTRLDLKKLIVDLEAMRKKSVLVDDYFSTQPMNALSMNGNASMHSLLNQLKELQLLKNRAEEVS